MLICKSRVERIFFNFIPRVSAESNTGISILLIPKHTVNLVYFKIAKGQMLKRLVKGSSFCARIECKVFDRSYGSSRKVLFFPSNMSEMKANVLQSPIGVCGIPARCQRD